MTVAMAKSRWEWGRIWASWIPYTYTPVGKNMLAKL